MHSKAGFVWYPQSSRLAAGVHPAEPKYLIRDRTALNLPTVSEEGARAMPLDICRRDVRTWEG